MRGKRSLALMLCLSTVVSLTGCGSRDEISNLNSMQALNSESTTKNDYSLSYTDEQKAIYAQVSNRTLLDLSALDSCSDSELQQVVTYMNGVDNQLVGKVYTADYQDKTERFTSEGYVDDDSVISSSLTDYLLTFMQQTPYYWQRTKTIVRGIDSNSRSIVVDVTYKTIDFKKKVNKDSTIVRGDPDYDKKSAVRYKKYLALLNGSETSIKDKKLFKKYYGDPKKIIAEQRTKSPTSSIYDSGNQQVYKGLIDSDAEKSRGTMSVRYIVVPKYVLGVNLGVTCEHMYITDFSLDTDPTEGLSAFSDEGYATVTDEVYNLIYSYFTCLDESDFNGLYKLTNNFASLDKHYEDVFDSTYQKHNGFTVSLFNITGTHITCGITISTKERAMTSNMTYPNYTDRYYAELELVGSTLKVNNLVLISRKLEGEPAIATTEADTSGFNAEIDLSNEDRVAIEKLISNMAVLQLKGDITSDKFGKLVDTSSSTNQVESMKSNIKSMSGVRKAVFLENYQQGTSNYASVKCRELFQKKDNSIVEAEVEYEFILKGGAWYIYNYDVMSSVKLDTTNLVTTDSLCLVNANKIESYTSQITGSKKASKDLDKVSDASVTYEHKQYTPILKKGVRQQGMVKLRASEIDDTKFKEITKMIIWTYKSYDEYKKDIEALEKLSTDSGVAGLASEVDNAFRTGAAVVYNINNSRYATSELSSVKAQTKATLNKASLLINKVSSKLENLGDSDKKVLECFNENLSIIARAIGD